MLRSGTSPDGAPSLKSPVMRPGFQYLGLGLNLWLMECQSIFLPAVGDWHDLHDMELRQ